MSRASALPENSPADRVAGTNPALAQLAVVDRQPGLRCHLDHDLLVRLAARHDPRHILLGASIAQIPAGHRALVGMAPPAPDFLWPRLPLALGQPAAVLRP